MGPFILATMIQINGVIIHRVKRCLTGQIELMKDIQIAILQVHSKAKQD